MAADLKDIRDRFKYDTEAWQEIRREGQTDMLCVSGQIWQALDPEGFRERNRLHRPAITLDELSQYVNQIINDIRANKRAIKVTAMPGIGSTRPPQQLEAEARFRANLIRQIEYRSNAPREAYTRMFEDAVQRSYGACRITSEYVNNRSFEQELKILPMHNPDLFTPDGDLQMADGADMRHCFVHEWWSKEDFKREYPKAKQGNALLALVGAIDPRWERENKVLVAEYWCYKSDGKDRLLALQITGKEQPLVVLASELEDEDGELVLPDGVVVSREREVHREKVVQQRTNGYDILDEKPWPGQYLPFVLCVGKVMFVDPGGGSKRIILSQVRLARDAAMAHNYIATCEIEAIGGVPRSQWVGYEGQFAGHEDEWAKANHEPVPYLEVKPRTDASGGELLPLPTRNSWDPPIQNLEIAKESFRRSIQAAQGSMPLPTDAQARNQKSGKALDKIMSSSQRGSYHFVDHFEGAVARVGHILNDLLPHYYDTLRDVTVRKPDDEPEVIRINDPAKPDGVQLTADGQFDVTISTGPSFDSEREAASDFADTLVGVSPQVFALLGPLIVKLKNLGPIGDEMAEYLEALQPPEVRQMKAAKDDPQAVARELTATKQQLQQVMQAASQMQRDLETDAAKQQAAKYKADLDVQVEREKALIQKELQIELQTLKNAAAIQIAEINARTKGVVVHAQAEAAHEEQALGQAFDAAMSDVEREHERQMAELGHEQALEQAEAGMIGEMAMQDRQMDGQREMQGMKMAGDLAKQRMAGEQQARMASMQMPEQETGDGGTA